MRLDARRLLALLLLAPAAGALLGGRGPLPPPRDTPAPLRVRLDANRASEAELLLLDGLGPGRVRALLDLRREAPLHGVEDLLAVPGVGPSTLERIRPDLEERFGGARPRGPGP